MNDQEFNYGYLEPAIEDDEYILGAVIDRQVLRPDGQWDDFLPEYEPQYGGGWDTSGCTVWGTQNVVETLDRYFNRQTNYAERYNYILGGVVHGKGANPHTIAECVRHEGLIPNEKLPMTKTYEEFITPKPMTERYLNMGKTWLNKFTLKHEWLWRTMPDTDERIAIIKDALQYSPLGCSVTAWYKRGDVYVDNGRPNGHWCMIFGWDDKLKAWKVFDSYLQNIKMVSYDHKISRVKAFYLTPKGQEKTNTLVFLLEKLADAYKQLLDLLKKKSQ